ncbi:MAG: hypothetical protein Q4E21_03230 [Clostridia bacterium]|nr:hypothetical protein [Clostridia bacterium]
MIWFLIAALLLLAACICLIRCFVLRRKAHTVSENGATAATETKDVTVIEGSSQNNPVYEKKAKRQLIVGIVLLALTEAAILIASKVTA